ncbi:MAG: phage portal protein [Dehalococcoidia bacterium]|nr:phage portal protein [Dehalococcoidia bacterium]
MSDQLSALERAITWLSPQWGARRALARARLDAVRAYFDGATVGRRGASIRRSIADANTVSARSLPRLRSGARDLVRNNAHARRAVEAIVSNTIGKGITPQFMRGDDVAEDIGALAKRHLLTTDCDADGRLTYAGLQSAAFAAMVEGGEVLVRRRWRRASDGLAVPVQYQLLEPEYLDDTKDGPAPNGGRIIQGVEYDANGRRRQYWLYREHPGAPRFHAISDAVPARDVAHLYRLDRPGQVRGIPWLSTVMLTLADFADYQDAQLVRQKMAACFVAFVTESFDGGLAPLGLDGEEDLIDSLEPGMIERLPPGTEVSFGNPPSVEGYSEYTRETLRAAAAGMGISYEAMTGDLKGVNFSSGRMGHLEFQRNIDRWRSLIFLPQFCSPLERWFLEAAAMTGANVEGVEVRHVPPRREMVDPTKEARADKDEIRAGTKTLSQTIRERGRDPREHLTELAADMALLDELGLTLDSDARQRVAAAGDEPEDPEEDAGQREAA